MRIGVTAVYVDDQDKARAFYAGVLSFQVKDDASYGDSARWLTVCRRRTPTAPRCCWDL